jgi:hypothetical protein
MVFEPRDPNRSRKALRYDRAYLYAPRWEENAFEVALDENARRLAKWIDSGSVKPRGPIPLLAQNAREKETLSGIRRNRIRALAREVQAARDERRNCERALRDPSLSGAARDEMQQKIDALDSTIKERSLPNPPEYSGSGPRRRLAPAQALANQLQEDGFLRARVTGYQGQGVSSAASKGLINADAEGGASTSTASERLRGWGSRSMAPPHALRIVPGDASQRKRRSEAGKVFAARCGLALAFPGT